MGNILNDKVEELTVEQLTDELEGLTVKQLKAQLKRMDLPLHPSLRKREFIVSIQGKVRSQLLISHKYYTSPSQASKVFLHNLMRAIRNRMMDDTAVPPYGVIDSYKNYPSNLKDWSPDEYAVIIIKDSKGHLSSLTKASTSGERQGSLRFLGNDRLVRHSLFPIQLKMVNRMPLNSIRVQYGITPPHFGWAVYPLHHREVKLMNWVDINPLAVKQWL